MLFHNLLFFPISFINSLSDLTNFEANIKNFLISLWIRPLFSIIPFNLIHFHQIGKFGNIFDTRPCEINDLAVPSRQFFSSFQAISTDSIDFTFEEVSILLGIARIVQKDLRLNDYSVIFKASVVSWKGESNI